MGETRQDEFECMTDGHVHEDLVAEVECSARFQLARLREENEKLKADMNVALRFERGDALRSALARKEAECAGLRASLQEIVDTWGRPNTPMWHRACEALAASPSAALDAVREAQGYFRYELQTAKHVGCTDRECEVAQVAAMLSRVFGEPDK